MNTMQNKVTLLIFIFFLTIHWVSACSSAGKLIGKDDGKESNEGGMIDTSGGDGISSTPEDVLTEIPYAILQLKIGLHRLPSYFEFRSSKFDPDRNEETEAKLLTITKGIEGETVIEIIDSLEILPQLEDCYSQYQSRDSYVTPDREVCISTGRLSRYPQDNIRRQLVGIFLHELSHIYGYGEDEAQSVQALFLKLEAVTLVEPEQIEKINRFHGFDYVAHQFLIAFAERTSNTDPNVCNAIDEMVFMLGEKGRYVYDLITYKGEVNIWVPKEDDEGSYMVESYSYRDSRLMEDLSDWYCALGNPSGEDDLQLLNGLNKFFKNYADHVRKIAEYSSYRPEYKINNSNYLVETVERLINYAGDRLIEKGKTSNPPKNHISCTVSNKKVSSTVTLKIESDPKKINQNTNEFKYLDEDENEYSMKLKLFSEDAKSYGSIRAISFTVYIVDDNLTAELYQEGSTGYFLIDAKEVSDLDFAGYSWTPKRGPLRYLEGYTVQDSDASFGLNGVMIEGSKEEYQGSLMRFPDKQSFHFACKLHE